MKRTLTIIFLLLFTGIIIFAQNTSFRNGAEYCALKHQHSANYALKQSYTDIPHSFNVLNYKLDVDIFNCFQSPYPDNFTATNTITMVADSTISQITLNAVNTSLEIDSVTLGGSTFTHSNNLLTITLDQTYNAGDTLMVKIWYQHKNVNGGDGAFYASGGFVFTDCEPEGARKWFPCWDKPSDKATTDITARVPSNVKLASNGRLADSTLDGDTMVYHWISRDPVATYLTILTSKTNYKLDIIYRPNPTGNDSTPIRFYYNNGENISSPRQYMVPMMNFYSEAFGEHPFEKNGFATLNNEFSWGGMENQTLTSLCPDCWSSDLLAHEFAHQWFGDMITCATWADIFLNEGFATWTEAHWVEHTGGYTAYHNEMEDNASYYMWSNPGWAISNPEWAINTPSTDILFDYAITYMKGSCVLHMLRYTLGDSLFFMGINQYATNPALRYHSARISDFKNTMEQASEQDLSWFFDEWIFEPNHPDYANIYNFVSLRNGQWRVNFNVNQNNSLSGTYFQMPLEVLIHFNQGQDTLIRVMNTINHEHFDWVFDRQPVSLVFDPNGDILLKEGTTTVGINESAVTGNDLSLICKPNPASGQTSINYYLPENATVSMKLFSITGKEQKIILNNVFETTGNHTLQCDVSALPSGLYFIRLETSKNALTHKLVVVK